MQRKVCPFFENKNEQTFSEADSLETSETTFRNNREGECLQQKFLDAFSFLNWISGNDTFARGESSVTRLGNFLKPLGNN